MVNLLIKNVHVADKNASFNGENVNILVENGIISSIGKDVYKDNTEIIDATGAYLSLGWVETFSDFCDPGYEYRETIGTGATAALAGGFTHVFVIPNVLPIIQNKSVAEYIVNKSNHAAVNVYPLGAVSKNAEGSELAEMYDMSASGSIAFSDGKNTIQSAGLLLKALQYVKRLNGVIVTQPVEATFGSNGLMNEGIISTQLGLPGMPAVAEHIMIMRDIELLRYTQSRMHITGISTAKSVELIRNAKQEGLQLTCSVTPHHLYFCDEDMRSYDTNLKVNVPLRTKADRDALRKGVIDGVIDSVAVHHFPQHTDDKDCEFEYAKNGMIGLQTAYAAVRSALPELTPQQTVQLFSSNNRNIFGLETNSIQTGQVADFTIFSPEENFIFTEATNQSKSANSPFFGIELKGKVLATVVKNNLYRN